MNEEWFEHLPLCVFVDTSALRAMHFNISHPSFETIRQAVEIGDIEIVVTDITKGEFIKISAAGMQESHVASSSSTQKK